MKTLEKNWFSTGLIDFEYKQYILLDYLQFIEGMYEEKKLYPSFQELIDVYKTTQEYKNNISTFRESIKTKKLIGADWSEPRLIFEDVIEPDLLVDEIERIVEFSLPLFKECIRKGREIYDSVDDDVEIKSIGVEPIHNSDGFLVVRYDKIFFVYKYSVSSIHENSIDQSRVLELEEFCRYKSTLSNNIDNIKQKLVKKNGNVNMSTYFIDINSIVVPMNETLLPIIRRKFLSSLFF